MASMGTAPKDRPILLKYKQGWFQGSYDPDFDPEWQEVPWIPETIYAFHGCQCCGGSRQTPTAWAELPTE